MSESAFEPVRRRPPARVRVPRPTLTPVPRAQALPVPQAQSLARGSPLPQEVTAGAWARGRARAQTARRDSVADRVAQFEQPAQPAPGTSHLDPVLSARAGGDAVRRLTAQFSTSPVVQQPLRRARPGTVAGNDAGGPGPEISPGPSPSAPPLPATATSARAPGRQLADLLAREPAEPPKPMVKMSDFFQGSDLETKDTREGWQEYRDRVAAIREELLRVAEERPGELEEYSGRLYEETLLQGAKNARGNYIVAPSAEVLDLLEIKPEPQWQRDERGELQRNPRAGRMQWAAPLNEFQKEMARADPTAMRREVPTTEHMTTEFGGSAGRGIYVLNQGQLYMMDAQKFLEGMTDAQGIRLAALPGVGGGESKMYSAYHSSFLAGEDVDAAGEIGIDADGRVTSISNMSGHHRPRPEHLINLLKYLHGRGVDISAVEVKTPDKAYATPAEFLTEYGGRQRHVRQWSRLLRGETDA